MRKEKEERVRYKTKAEQYEHKLKELKKGLKSRESLIQSLEQTQDELKTQVQTLQVRQHYTLHSVRSDFRNFARYVYKHHVSLTCDVTNAAGRARQTGQ